MGSKCSILAISEDLPRVAFNNDWSANPVASRAIAERLTGEGLADVGEQALDSALWPNPGMIYAGSSAGADVVTWDDLRSAQPSSLTSWVAKVAPDRNAYLVIMDSTVDWAAFAVWIHGILIRSVSVSYDDGVIENLGETIPFEQDFWNGTYRGRVPVDYPLEFPTSVLGNEALRTFFGFVLEGRWDPEAPDPEDIAVYGFRLPGADQREADLRIHARQMIRR